MKLLISWYAYTHDFIKKEGVHVDENGPTVQFYDCFYENASYDKHVLLTTAREADGDPAIEMLAAFLRRKYPKRVVEPVYVDVNDPINLLLIKNKVEAILLEYREYEIDIFFSPGTSAMQLSWYICHTSLGLKTRLLQSKAAKFTTSKKPELLEIQVETSTIPYSAVIAEQKLQRRSSNTDYLLTESLIPIYERARLVAKAEGVTCLISGESGTGKEHLARYVHQQSARATGKFVSVNCSALGDSLLESRLFGYVKGAFTDAKEDRKGYFDEADGGTLFLDEIGDISPYMQQLLLRVLQEGEIIPVGATKTRKVNVRVIAATHRDVESMCEAGTFRWDLYYRLAVVELNLMPLRQRGEKDKKALIDFFLKKARKEFTKPDLRLSQKAQEAILHYPFPGNVRELENLITNVAVFTDGEIQTTSLPSRLTRLTSQKNTSLNWAIVEKDLLERALQHYKGNQSQACKAVGYKAINTFRSKLKQYGIEP
ncbi:sigma-54 interaction domain-containing protein [uncultured Fibrella sp.]|uniref:sigma-54 interaction domain-containing protein n=1 Tax=uncultured Fibrella sp. TaxID=1284596 RepID=UPI0035CA3231